MNCGIVMQRATNPLVLAGLIVTTVLSPGWSDAADNILGPIHTAIQMPVVGGRNLGFTTQLEIAEEDSAGYIPVRITFNAIGNLPADRRLVYRFRTVPGGESPPQNGLTVDLPINVAQGTRSQSFVRYLPKWSAGQAVDVSIYEDGRLLEDYTAAIGSVLRGNYQPLELLKNEHLTNWVFIYTDKKSAATTVPKLRSALPHSFVMGATINRTFDPTFQPTLEVIGHDVLPSDWRAYQRSDVIATETETLIKLQENKACFRAIRDWVLNGGAVLVLDAPSPQMVLDQLDFQWTNEESSADKIRSVVRDFDYYRKIDVNRLADLQQQQRLSSSRFQRYSPKAIDNLSRELEQYDQTPAISAAEWNELIWLQPAGAGYVIGIKEGADTVPSRTHLTIAAQTLGAGASPTIRRGVDPLIGDGRFSEWLIPGVAQPPVYTFMGLLASFVILVGPIAYRRTSKYGRSYLMFAIAPVLALVTTLAMFGYGIVADGFGTVVRVRQVTWVDGRSGDAGERVRSTYFAGVRPGDGLRFPGNAEVIRYPQPVGDSWEDQRKLSPETLGRVLVRDDAQIFDSSFLPSRQQRQFVVHRPRPNVGYLSLTADPQGTVRKIESGFDFDLHLVVVRDERGDYWSVKDLKSGTTRVSELVEQKVASKMLGQMYIDHRPLRAVRETRRPSDRSSNRETYDVIANTNRQLGAKSNVNDGFFERWLQQNLQTLSEIPKGHFVATADISSDVLAVQECQPVSSIRYLIGTLR